METTQGKSGAPGENQPHMLETLIRGGLVGALVLACAWVVSPFFSLLLWALILAVILYPLHQKLANGIGGKQGRAAAVLVLAGLLLVGTPTIMLGSSFASFLHKGYVAFEQDTIHLPAPPAGVNEWPLVGEQLYSGWDAAARDLPAFVEKNKAQLASMSRKAFGIAANTIVALLLFLGSLVIAGIMMAYGREGSAAIGRIMGRLAGAADGPNVQALSTATVRSVASGVVGVAFIQALILGVGFILAGIPAAGVLAFLVLIVGILQLPALIISLPAIVILWASGDGSNTANVAYTIYLLLGGMADNVLKPLLLGRGVDAPMAVVLLGALGGMVVAGIIGLFVGAVVLAVGYQALMRWVDGSGVDAAASQ